MYELFYFIGPSGRPRTEVRRWKRVLVVVVYVFHAAGLADIYACGAVVILKPPMLV
jgi:hypothetical protein